MHLSLAGVLISFSLGLSVAFVGLSLPLLLSSPPPSLSSYFRRPYIQHRLQSPFTPVFVHCLLTWPSVDIWLTAPSVLRTVRKRCENREISTLHTNDNMHSRALTRTNAVRRNGGDNAKRAAGTTPQSWNHVVHTRTKRLNPKTLTLTSVFKKVSFKSKQINLCPQKRAPRISQQRSLSEIEMSMPRGGVQGKRNQDEHHRKHPR